MFCPQRTLQISDGIATSRQPTEVHTVAYSTVDTVDTTVSPQKASQVFESFSCVYQHAGVVCSITNSYPSHTCMLPTLHVFILIFLFPTPTTPSLPTSICPPCFCKHEMITSHNYTMLIYHMTRPSKTPYLHWVTSVLSHYNTLKSNNSLRRRSLLPLNLYHVITYQNHHQLEGNTS